MYSWEIEQLINARNKLLTVDEYFKVASTKDNPQICYMEYDCYNNEVKIDTNDNYHFKVKLKK